MGNEKKFMDLIVVSMKPEVKLNLKSLQTLMPTNVLYSWSLTILIPKHFAFR